MKRLVLLCLVPLLLAFPAGADCLDDIKAQLSAIQQRLAMGDVPPVVVPPTVPPVTPPATPSCAQGGPYIINGQGTLRGVCLPAVIQVRNAMPGARLIWVKQPIIVAGRARLTEGGVPVGGDGYGPDYNIPMGDHDFVLASELPGMIVAVQVR